MTSASMKICQTHNESRGEPGSNLGQPDTDEVLVRAAQAGDVQAFSTLVETHQRVARAIAFSVTSDYSITEDLAQEAMVTAWLKISDLGDPTKFRSWLATIVRNTARYWRRHQGRHAPRAQYGLEVLEQLPDPEGGPLESAMNRQDQDHARHAFEGLPARYKEPLLLYYCLDESHAQVASALGVSEAAVRQRICRARKKLKQDLSGVERTSQKLRSRVSAAASVLLIIQSRQSWASAGAQVSTTSLLASPKIFMGLGALAGGALVACVGAIVLFVSSGQHTSSSESLSAPAALTETKADTVATVISENSTAGAETSPASVMPGAAQAEPEDFRGLVYMGTGRVKEKSDSSTSNLTTRTRAPMSGAVASASKESVPEDNLKARGGRVHKHGPARLQPGSEVRVEATKPMLRPTLNLKAVQKELWSEK